MYTIAWILRSMAWIPGQIIIRFWYGYRVVGRENLKKIAYRGNGVLFISNHRSQLDPVFVAAALPFFSRLRPMYFISLPPYEYAHLAVGKYLYGGVIFRLFGSYPVYRGLKDYEKSFVHHIELLGKGRSVCIFPEGAITKDAEGRPQSPRPGVGYLAQRTGATIVPIAITGEKIVEVRIGEPFVSSGETPEELMAHVVRLGNYTYTHGS